jgi:hypothetical protein
MSPPFLRVYFYVGKFPLLTTPSRRSVQLEVGLTRGNSIFIMEILTHQSKHQWNSKSTVTEAKTFCKRRWNLPQATTKPTMAGWKNEMTRDTPEALSMTCYAESHHCLCLHYCLICLTHYLTTRLPIRLGLVS